MKEPFQFCAAAGVPLTTNITCDSLSSLLYGLKKVSGASIFYHLHHSLLRRHFTTSDHMNDFARWILLNLGQITLAEKLACVDPMSFNSIREARMKMIELVDPYVAEGEHVMRVAPEHEFYFMELKNFVVKTDLFASDLRSFLKCLRKASMGMYFFHLIQARIRLGTPDNDFSFWLEWSLREKKLAREIRTISPYIYNIWEIKGKIIKAVERRLAS